MRYVCVFCILAIHLEEASSVTFCIYSNGSLYIHIVHDQLIKGIQPVLIIRIGQIFCTFVGFIIVTASVTKGPMYVPQYYVDVQ